MLLRLVSASLLAASLLATAACGSDDPPLEPDATPAPDTVACRDFVAISAHDRIALWRVVDGVKTAIVDDVSMGFAVSRDGTRVAVARPFAVHIHDLDTGVRTVIPVDGGTPTKLDWSAKDPTVILGGKVSVLDAARGEVRTSFANAQALLARLSPTGDEVAWTNSRVLSIGRVSDGSVVTRTYEAEVTMLGWFDGGVHTVVHDRQIRLDSARVVDTTIQIRSGRILADSVLAAMSPQGTVANIEDRATAIDGLKFWTPADGSFFEFAQLGVGFAPMSWTDDGELVWSTESTELESGPGLWIGKPGAAPRRLADASWENVHVLGSCD